MDGLAWGLTFEATVRSRRVSFFAGAWTAALGAALPPAPPGPPPPPGKPPKLT